MTELARKCPTPAWTTLQRIQFSAFMGELNWTHQKELLLKIKRRIGSHDANVQLFPLDEKSWTSRRVIEQKKEE